MSALERELLIEEALKPGLMHRAIEAQKAQQLRWLVERGNGRISADKIRDVIADLQAGVPVTEIMATRRCGKDFLNEIRQMLGLS